MHSSPLVAHAFPRPDRLHAVTCNVLALPQRGHRNYVMHISTERQVKVCTWLRELSFCPAWVLLSKTCKPLFAPLYSVPEVGRSTGFPPLILTNNAPCQKPRPPRLSTSNEWEGGQTDDSQLPERKQYRRPITSVRRYRAVQRRK